MNISEQINIYNVGAYIMTYKARLNRAVNAFAKSIQWWDSEAAALAQIKLKAAAHIKAHPQPKAVFLIG
jgi:hypothetical protein